MTPEAYLPAHLQGATIEKITAGLSGAGVYKVVSGDAAYVLKIADAPIDVAIRTAAAEAGVAPKIIYVDPTRHAVLSELVVDRGFMPLLMTPATRPQAIASLGTTLRRVHDLPIPDGATPATPRAHLQHFTAALANADVPAFVRTAQDRALAEPEPPVEREPVVSHNDVNPSNLVWDGEHVRLLDWDTAAPNDPFYDLAAAAMFLRMDEATCFALLEAHDGVAPAALPARFAYWRRMVAAMCGSIFLSLARHRGYAGSSADEGMTLAEAYGQMRTGALQVATGEGQWAFGLALLRESLAL
jgi:aminoglycoside phosphotransferase